MSWRSLKVPRLVESKPRRVPYATRSFSRLKATSRSLGSGNCERALEVTSQVKLLQLPRNACVGEPGRGIEPLTCSLRVSRSAD